MYYGIIYMIRNKLNGKIYFGQTIEQRGFNGRYKGGQWWKYSDNEHLKNSYDKYGLDNFEVIKQFDVAYSKEELDDLEDMYICLYDTINPRYGYNKNVVEVMENIRKRLYKNNEKINQNYMGKIILSMGNITLTKQKQK